MGKENSKPVRARGQSLTKNRDRSSASLTNASCSARAMSRAHGKYFYSNRVAADPVHGPALRGEFSRPRECRLCGADNESRSGPGRGSVRHRRGNFLSRIFFLRSAVERDSGKGRRAALDLPHHVHLGPCLHGDGVRARTVELLWLPFSTRRCRGRVLSRHDALSHLLVPAERAGEIQFAVLRGYSAVERAGLAAFRLHSGFRGRVRVAWLAMAVSDRRLAVVSAGVCR